MDVCFRLGTTPTQLEASQVLLARFCFLLLNSSIRPLVLAYGCETVSLLPHTFDGFAIFCMGGVFGDSLTLLAVS